MNSTRTKLSRSIRYTQLGSTKGFGFDINNVFPMCFRNGENNVFTNVTFFQHVFRNMLSGKHLQTCFWNILSCKTFQKTFKKWHLLCYKKCVITCFETFNSWQCVKWCMKQNISSLQKSPADSSLAQLAEHGTDDLDVVSSSANFWQNLFCAV